MITELMLILTVVGAGIILVVWTNSRKRKRVEMDRQEVAESANEFKVELEKTANEIIGRMETQANHLESLLDDSERNRAQLEGRVTELKKLLKRTENQSTEIRDLLERLDDAVEDVETMQKQMDAIEKKINSALNAQIPQNSVLGNVPQIVPPSMINPLIQTAPITPQPVPQPVINPIPAQVVTPPPIIRQTVTPVQAPPSIVEKAPPVVEQVAEEKKPPEEFSKVLEKTMREEEPAPKPSRIPVPPDRNSIVLSREIKTPAKVVAAEPVKIDPTRKKFEPVGSIAERQAKVLEERKNHKKSEVSERSAEIRKAAVAAIKNAINNETIIDISPVTEELKTVERLQALKERAENIADKVSEPVPVKSENVNIREMLLSGMSVEEVARETGLGRGAVELVQQMTKRQLERK